MKEDEYIRSLGNQIKRLRLQNEYSLLEFSLILEIDKSSLTRIESGRTNPTVKTLKRIADKLNVKVSELFAFED
jgi:transcriptional regulator with XRE-family HTH domain